MPSQIIASSKTQPHIRDIVDIEQLNTMFQSYSDITGMTTALLDLDGEVLIATNWQDSCMKFHRANEVTSKRCLESDTALAGALEEGDKYNVYRCKNGLVDVATPVFIDGTHMANFFIGQFFYEKPNLEQFATQAEDVGFNKTEYLQAISNVPVYDEKTIKQHMVFLVQLAEMVGNMAAAQLRIQSIVDERTHQLKQSLEVAEQASRAKTNFLTNMSHELRTPLHAVLGFAEILYAKEKEPQKKGYLGSINTAGTGLLCLLNSILDVTKIESGKMPIQNVAMSLKALATEVFIIFERQAAEKDLELNLDLEHDLPAVVNFDTMKLRQILINLVGNAIKFTDNGHITIKIRTAPSTKEHNCIDLDIFIEDSGKGICPEDQHRIFDAFEQARGQNISEYGGTGIGLALTKQLCDVLDGELCLNSNPNQGSCFHCHFREVEVLPSDCLMDSLEKEKWLKALSFKDAVILVVDDNQLNRDLMTTYLNEFNFTFLEATNGREAIQLAKQHLPDVIFMDMKMPVMNGYDATKHLKQSAETRHIPVIAATASALADEETRIRAYTDDYLKKPIQKFDLLKSLHQYIGEAEQTNAVQPINNVLIADDNMMNCELLLGMLDDHNGLSVSVVHSGNEAVQAACESRGQDLIFMDYYMPGLNGLEATKAIREWEIKHKLKPALIYALTAVDNDERRALEASHLFNGIIGKPFDSIDIKKIIENSPPTH